MSPSLPDPDFIAVLVLGLAAPAVGLLALLTRPSPRLRLAAGAAALGLAAAAAAGAAAGLPRGYWLPPAGLAAWGGACLAFRSRRVARSAAAVGAFFRRPWLPGTGLIAAGPALAAAWAWWVFPVIPAWDPPAGLALAHEPVRLRPDPNARPATDAGRPLRLYHPADPPTSNGRLLDLDATVVSARGLNMGLLRTAPPDEGYNCHGWVFAGGRGWIQGAEVEDILRDNGYAETAEPLPGDLIIYRDGGGAVAHSGVVRAVGPGCPLLIESKWGKGGRFLSPPEAPPYGERYSFYRSPRQGHQLHNSGDAPKGGRTPAEPEQARQMIP
jgi:hypothetical protein